MWGRRTGGGDASSNLDFPEMQAFRAAAQLRAISGVFGPETIASVLVRRPSCDAIALCRP